MNAIRKLLPWTVVLVAAVQGALAAEPVIPGNPAPPVEMLMKRPGTLGVFDGN